MITAILLSIANVILQLKAHLENGEKQGAKTAEELEAVEWT
jgi:hypothetical protein